MTARLLTCGTIVCDAMRDGYVRVGPPGRAYRDVVLSPDTHEALNYHERMPAFYAAVMDMPTGTSLIPLSVIAPAVRDLALALEYAEALGGAGDRCVMMHCWQDVTSTERGYALCAEHASQAEDWDSLTA